LTSKQITVDENQVTLDKWLRDRFVDKLKEASLMVNNTGKPLVLYRNILEESETAVQEEVAMVNEKYVVIDVFTYGGFLPASFQQQYVFTLYDFSIWIMRRSGELFFRCINNLDDMIL
jgi:hypothetical protein